LCHRNLAFQTSNQSAQSNTQRRKLTRVDRLLIVAMLSPFAGFIARTTRLPW
jgi:hypothetical protein